MRVTTYSEVRWTKVRRVQRTHKLKLKHKHKHKHKHLHGKSQSQSQSVDSAPSCASKRSSDAMKKKLANRKLKTGHTK